MIKYFLILTVLSSFLLAEDLKESVKVKEIVKTLKEGTYKERAATEKKIDLLNKEELESLKKILKESKDPELTNIYKKRFLKEKTAENKDVDLIKIMQTIIPRFKIKGNLKFTFAALEAMHPNLKFDVQATSGEMNFDFENMPTEEVIKYICISSGCKYKIKNNKVVIFN